MKAWIALATAFVAAAGYAATPAGRSAAGKELVGDPGFEHGKLDEFFLIGPVDHASTAIVKDERLAHGGRRVLRIQKIPGFKDGKHGAFLGKDIGKELRHGDRIDLAAWVRLASNRRSVVVAGLVVIDAKDKPLHVQATTVDKAEAWTEVKVTTVIPDKSIVGDWKGVFAFISADPEGGAAGAQDSMAQLLVDDFQIVRARGK